MRNISALLLLKTNLITCGYLHSKITMAGDVVPYYTVTALVPTLKWQCCFFEVAPMLPWSTHAGTPTE